ncbi:MAG TPA: sugar ABC transporter permease [Spirochaetia bacterium]|nr:sugar ABC transporter permease [Spirochaetia bacterium]
MYHTRKDHVIAFLIVLPSVIAVGIFVYGFIGWSIRSSLSAWDGIVPDFRFVGLAHYADIFTSQRFQTDLWNTLFFTLFFLAISILFGLLLATMLDRKVKGEGLFRNIYLFPMAISFVVTGVVWRWIFSPTMGINALLKAVGLGSLTWGWFTDPAKFLNFHVALIPLIIAASWQLSGYTMAMYLAALRGIPAEVREAARLDGASELRTYVSVILPMLQPITLSALIVLAHISLKIFDLVYTMTGTGPAFATDMPGIFMFETTFRGNHYAEGAAISIVMLLMIAVIIIPYLYNSLRREERT